MTEMQHSIEGVVFLEPSRFHDTRGFFSPAVDLSSLNEEQAPFLRINNSLSVHRHTLRGLHLQLPPASEAKLIRVISGSIWDVVLDLRAQSSTYGAHLGVELSAKNRNWLYIPSGCAHGFLTLADQTEVLYLSSSDYRPELEKGIRWNDPHFQINWPATPQHFSEKDIQWPFFDPSAPLVVDV